ncbi:MAG: restriction endonuclease [Rubrivivax sp.]
MPRNSLFAVLLRAPWWVSLAIAGVMSLVLAALLPDNYRVVGVLSTFPFVVIAALAAWRQAQLPSATEVARTQEAVAAMTWGAFSARLEEAFRNDGFEVQAGKAAPVDFELARGGRRMLVSARRGKSAQTGVEPLRALQAARQAADASDALLICMGGLTDTARPFAAQHEIKLWQAAEIAQALRPGRTGLPK